MSKIGMSKIIYEPASYELNKNTLVFSGAFAKNISVEIPEQFECKIFQQEK